MRHLVKGKKLGRVASHRKSTLRSLAIALIEEHRIKTTVAKAKALRPYVEPLITLAKIDSSNNRRKAFSELNNKGAVSKLFNEVAVKAKNRPGGYTRVIKIGNRLGDGAETALIELVDYNDIQPENNSTKSGTRRSGS
jgi:large subunit ribosomal protein L17